MNDQDLIRLRAEVQQLTQRHNMLDVAVAKLQGELAAADTLLVALTRTHPDLQAALSALRQSWGPSSGPITHPRDAAMEQALQKMTNFIEQELLRREQSGTS